MTTKKELQSQNTRDQFLTAGIQILHNPEKRFRDVTTRGVAEEAGRTTGAFFNQWDNQEQFHRDLTARILSSGNDMPFTIVNEETIRAKLAGDDTRFQWSKAYLASLIIQPTFGPRMAIWHDKESIPGAVEQLAVYHERQRHPVSSSIRRMLEVTLPMENELPFVIASEGLALSLYRAELSPADSAQFLTALIPEA
jgi:AcrR family transcriptional regulator